MTQCLNYVWNNVCCDDPWVLRKHTFPRHNPMQNHSDRWNLSYQGKYIKSTLYVLESWHLNFVSNTIKRPDMNIYAY